MSCKLFEQITKFLHFEDQKADSKSRTRKFQRVLNMINEIAGALAVGCEHLSIDEQVIAYEGKKSSLRQYNPKKPKKWGFKIFVLSGRSGLIHKMGNQWKDLRQNEWEKAVK